MLDYRYRHTMPSGLAAALPRYSSPGLGGGGGSPKAAGSPAAFSYFQDRGTDAPPPTLLSLASTHGATAAQQAVGGRGQKGQATPLQGRQLLQAQEKERGEAGDPPFPQSLVASRPLLQEAPPPPHLRRFLCPAPVMNPTLTGSLPSALGPLSSWPTEGAGAEVERSSQRPTSHPPFLCR